MTMSLRVTVTVSVACVSLILGPVAVASLPLRLRRIRTVCIQDVSTIVAIVTMVTIITIVYSLSTVTPAKAAVSNERAFAAVARKTHAHSRTHSHTITRTRAYTRMYD